MQQFNKIGTYLAEFCFGVTGLDDDWCRGDGGRTDRGVFGVSGCLMAMSLGVSKSAKSTKNITIAFFKL